MNATCTHCGTVFRVDPAKVPSGGVSARCSICRKVFHVGEVGAGGDAGTGSPAPAAPSPSALPEVAAPAAPVPAPPAAPAPAPPSPPSAPAVGERPPAAAEPAEAPAPAAAASSPPTTAEARPASSPFGSNDPDAKARRLARALVSDMVTYHPDRREAALSSGTLKQEFREEIKKSWEEYVEQVGKERAMQTPHFREALNQILARGQAVF